MNKRSSVVVFKSVLFALVLREMQSRFGEKRFGAFWLLFEPIVQISLMVAIFSFRSHLVLGGIDFIMFLVTGMVPFFMMRGISFKCMDAISANKALFSYKQIKPFDTFVARALVEVVLYSCVYFLLLMCLQLWFEKNVFHNDLFFWWVVLSVGVIFSFALGILFCILGEYLPEIKGIIRIMYFPIYLISGVVFPIWLVPESMLSWFLWNPYLHIIESLRGAVFVSYPKTFGISLVYPAVVSLFLLFIALALYRTQRVKLVSL